MKIKQLGNNGGLGDPTLTNSSFLIDLYDDHSEYLLFDCGYNVMARLVREEYQDPNFEISKIKHVVISHKHDDHCGNLETLVYWNHFKNDVQMNIYVACKGLRKTVKDTRKIEKDFKTIKAKTYEHLEIVGNNSSVDFNNGISMWFHEAKHGAKPAVGIWIGNSTKAFFISGDSKALPEFEDYCMNSPAGSVFFHDYSNWDDESKNVHACKTDFERVYSQKFRNKITKYHTGDTDFNAVWQ